MIAWCCQQSHTSLPYNTLWYHNIHIHTHTHTTNTDCSVNLDTLSFITSLFLSSLSLLSPSLSLPLSLSPSLSFSLSLSLFLSLPLSLSLSPSLSFSLSLSLSLSPLAVDRVLPNIRSYLCQVLKQEKLSLEAEALRARYEAMLNSLEKATTREPSSSLQTPPTTSRVNLRHSMHVSDNGRQKGQKREKRGRSLN